MNSALELHDSQVKAIAVSKCEARSEVEALLHFSTAYIHRSPGIAGRSPGTVWLQAAELFVKFARFNEPLPPMPNTISGGEIEVDCCKYANVLPLPFDHSGPLWLSLDFMDGTSLVMTGRAARLQLVGEATYLEAFW